MLDIKKKKILKNKNLSYILFINNIEYIYYYSFEKKTM